MVYAASVPSTYRMNTQLRTHDDKRRNERIYAKATKARGTGPLPRQ